MSISKFVLEASSEMSQCKENRLEISAATENPESKKFFEGVAEGFQLAMDILAKHAESET